MDKLKELRVKYDMYIKIGLVVMFVAVVLGGGLHGIADYAAGAITAYLIATN